MRDLQLFFDCTMRATDACIERYAECSAERIANFQALDGLATSASDSVMATYAELEEHHATWSRQSAVRSLKPVFEAVAKARYNSLNPNMRIMCTGRTAVRNLCTAQLQTSLDAVG